MDSLKTLIDRKEYEIVIKLTESSNSCNDLFYRISALVCLGKYEEALYVVQDHQQTLEENLTALITIHINLLCSLSRFDQAYSVLDYYSNLPYQSQVVEETLRKMPEIIIAEEKKMSTFAKFEDETIFEMLASSENQDVLFALDILKDRDIFAFLPEIEKILLSYPSEIIKSYAAMLLVKKELDRKLKINKNGEIFDFNPKYQPAPFTGEIFNSTIRKFDHGYRDSTLSQIAGQLFSQYCIYIYPRPLKYSPDLYAVVFYIISNAYLKTTIDNNQIEELCQRRHLNRSEVEKAKKEVENAIDSF